MSQHFPYTTKEYPYYFQTNTLGDQHLINMNIRKHEFFYNAEENPINEENPIIEEESSDRESSDEEVECQACHGNINTVSEVAVLHPCNHAFHFAQCIKNRFRKNPKCPVCGTEAVKLRRMSSREGSFYDLLAPEVKKQAANEFLTSNLLSLSSKGHFCNGLFFPAEMLAVRRYIYSKRLFCESIATSQYSVFSKIASRNFKNDPRAEHQIRLWIRREVQVLAYSDRNRHHLLTRTPNEIVNFEFCVVTLLQMKKKERKATLRGLELFLGTYTNVFLHELGAFLMSRYQTLEEWDRNLKYPLYQPGSSTETSSTQATPTQTTHTQATPIQATPIQAAPKVRPRLYRSSGLLSRYNGRGSDSVLVSSRAQLQPISNVSQENVQQTAEESLAQNKPHNTKYSLGSELPQVPGSTFDPVIVNSLAVEPPQTLEESLIADSPRNAEELIAAAVQEIMEGTLDADMQQAVGSIGFVNASSTDNTRQDGQDGQAGMFQETRILLHTPASINALGPYIAPPRLSDEEVTYNQAIEEAFF
ncbi:hypothetical protein OCU04_009314 [Sclerotinia nivalis]|uniref:RING-type E3 ubiquitin transferase n=1 Tax=Sclerotinia nivalis TaxID=352851 RepID=A0A9X0AET2_9HELO|nr:hypothetical protein OCU04_009314 [Sclerotinia nivalis]